MQALEVSVGGFGLVRRWFWSYPLVALVLSVGGFDSVRWWFRPLVVLGSSVGGFELSSVGGFGPVRWWFWSRPLVVLVSSVGVFGLVRWYSETAPRPSSKALDKTLFFQTRRLQRMWSQGPVFQAILILVETKNRHVHISLKARTIESIKLLIRASRADSRQPRKVPTGTCEESFSL